MMVERNWLIRTSQNQILGPVAKAKVLEFLQKGALGLNDEVTSGNGYWISLKEKDLVDKYLYGDVPQGYNPISESKSVLSHRENPDKTTSLNTAPANKTQVLKSAPQSNGVLPANDDLEYPDLTMVNTNLSELTAQLDPLVKLPNQDDLEFPDITLIATTIKNNPHIAVKENRPVENTSRPTVQAQAEVSSGLDPIVYPEDDDLAYPDMMSASAEIPVESECQFSIEKPVQVAVAEIKKAAKDFKIDLDDDSGLTLLYETMPEEKEDKPLKAEPVLTIAKKKDIHKDTHAHTEDKKLLHERKVKASAHKEAIEVTRDIPKEVKEPPVRSMPEHLKKRNDNYLMYMLVIIVLILLSLFFYYYRTILNKPLPV